MKKNRQKLLLTSIASLSLLCSLALATREVNSQDHNILVTPTGDIKIEKISTSADGSLLVKYTLTPDVNTAIDFSTELNWDTSKNANYETLSWYEDKDPNSYIDYTLNQEEKQISFKCKEAFGTRIIFTMFPTSNSDVKGKLSIDYARKTLTQADVRASQLAFENGKNISFTKIKEVKSVGTIGERAKDNFSLESSYGENGIYTYDSLFQDCEIQENGLYSQEWKYNGKSYSTASSAFTAIKENVKEYFLNLLQLEDAPAFSSAALKECLTYEIPAYSIAGQTQYVKRSFYEKFVTNYVTNSENGAGFKAAISLDGELLKEFTFSLLINETFLTGISFEDGQITF